MYSNLFNGILEPSKIVLGKVISIKPEVNPNFRSVYKRPPITEKLINETVTSMLEKDIREESNSQWSFNPCLVPKNG